VLLSLSNSLNSKKTPGGKKYIITSYSTAKNMPEIVEVKPSSCGLQKKLRLRNCGDAVAEQHSFKSCRIAIAEVLPLSCGIAISDSKKSCACPRLYFCESIEKNYFVRCLDLEIWPQKCQN
jgi:hypothetical protein